jgi:hypothetical protein
MKEFIVPQEEISIMGTKSTIQRGNKPYVLFAAYGALLNLPNGILHKRIKEDFKRIGKDVAASDMEEYFLGMYQMPNMELNFQKRGNAINNPDNLNPEFEEFEGKGTISLKFNSYAVIGVYAIPRVSLQGGSVLMTSEGCQRAFSPFHERNEYVLWSNVATNTLMPIENKSRPCPDWFTGGTSEYFIFVASQKSLAKEKLFPSADYLTGIIDGYKWAKAQGYQIENDYINNIEVKGTKVF